jgi:hypothetical protein
MPPRSLQLRAVLDEWYPLVVLAFVLVGLAGGWVAYTTFVAPGTTTEQRVVGSWERSGQFDHRATVTENNSVFPVGTTLSDRPVYPTAVAPTVNGTFTYTYAASDEGNLSVSADTRLRYRGVEGSSGQQSTELWRTSRPLSSESTRSLAPSEELAVPFALDAHRIRNRSERIREELDSGSGRVETAVVVETHVIGTVNSERVDNTTTYTLPLEVSGESVRLRDPEPLTTSRERTTRVTVPVQHGVLREGAGVLLPCVGILGTGALALARSRGWIALSPAERERLAHERDRGEFDEWITSGTLPEEIATRPCVRVDSLQGLVDLAIDTDSRVIEDARYGYAVIHDGLLYVYATPGGGRMESDLQVAVDADD